MASTQQSGHDSQNDQSGVQRAKRLTHPFLSISVLMLVGIFALGVVLDLIPPWAEYGSLIMFGGVVSIEAGRRLGYLSGPIVGRPQWRYVAYAALGPLLATVASTIWGEVGFYAFVLLLFAPLAAAVSIAAGHHIMTEKEKWARGTLVAINMVDAAMGDRETKYLARREIRYQAEKIAEREQSTDNEQTDNTATTEPDQHES